MEHDQNEVVERAFGDVDATALGSMYVEVFRRWSDAATPVALPPRSIIDPGWVGRLISSSMLFQVEGEDMRHRVVGQHFVNRNGGFDPTGKTLMDLFSTRPVARVLYPEYRRVVADAVPAILSLNYLTVKEFVRHSKILVLPFSDQAQPSRTVTHILSIYRFDDRA